MDKRSDLPVKRKLAVVFVFVVLILFVYCTQYYRKTFDTKDQSSILASNATLLSNRRG
jgi:hypothetical protein